MGHPRTLLVSVGKDPWTAAHWLGASYSGQALERRRLLFCPEDSRRGAPELEASEVSPKLDRDAAPLDVHLVLDFVRLDLLRADGASLPRPVPCPHLIGSGNENSALESSADGVKERRLAITIFRTNLGAARNPAPRVQATSVDRNEGARLVEDLPSVDGEFEGPINRQCSNHAHLPLDYSGTEAWKPSPWPDGTQGRKAQGPL